MNFPGRGLALVLLAAVLLMGAADRRAKYVPPSSRSDVVSQLPGPWFRARTPHFRVYSDSPVPLDAFQLSGLEASFERIADGLSLPDSLREAVRREPIEFYYTRHRWILESLSGMDAGGVSFPDFRVIVSTRLPHAHEVAHVLLQAAIRPRTPSTVPLLQEGLASWWGGTSGAAPPVLFEEAARTLETSPVRLSDYLMPDVFRRDSLDSNSRYAVAALFCEFFSEKFSMQTLHELYALLAANEEDAESRPLRATVLQFEGFTEMTWEELQAEFRTWVGQRARGGIEFAARPGRPADGVVAEEDHRVRWWWQTGELVVEMETDAASPVDAEFLWGELLRSRQHVGSQAQPAWRRWGLRVQPSGADLSDHRMGRRLALLRASRVDPAGVADPEASHWLLRVDVSGVDDLTAPAEVELFVTPRFQPQGLAGPRSDD